MPERFRSISAPPALYNPGHFLHTRNYTKGTAFDEAFHRLNQPSHDDDGASNSSEDNDTKTFGEEDAVEGRYNDYDYHDDCECAQCDNRRKHHWVARDVYCRLGSDDGRDVGDNPGERRVYVSQRKDGYRSIAALLEPFNRATSHSDALKFEEPAQTADNKQHANCQDGECYGLDYEDDDRCL